MNTGANKPLPQRGQVKKSIVKGAINATKNALACAPSSSSASASASASASQKDLMPMPKMAEHSYYNHNPANPPQLSPLFTFAVIPYANYGLPPSSVTHH
jgi:hypothetical protein